MMTSHPLAPLQRAKLLPVIRAHSADDALWGAERLIGLGLSVLEITWTVPNAASVVGGLTEKHPNVSIGAGTILSWQQYQQAKTAGAHWFISPMLDEALTQRITDDGSVYIPAIMTPTELYRACLLGVPAMKLFPAGAIGPENGFRYLSALTGPFDAVRFIPTGSIGLEEVPQWLAAGALAVGLGSALVSPDLLAKRDSQELARRVALVQSLVNSEQTHAAE